MIINKKEQQEIPQTDWEAREELYRHVMLLSLTPKGQSVGDCIETDYDPSNDRRYSEREVIDNKICFHFRVVQVGERLWRIWRRL